MGKKSFEARIKKAFDGRFCHTCGGELQLSQGPGRFKSYRGQAGYEIPANLKFPHCSQCGAEWLTNYQLEILEEHFEKLRADRYFSFTTSGRIFQAPDWWLFLSCEHDLIDYYRWFCCRYGLNVLKSSKSGPHVSLVRGERPTNHAEWKRMLGQNFEFKYSNQIRYNDEHVWLDVEPKVVNQIRIKLGLPTYPSYHVTLGRFRHMV
jgi:hypothetical protein